MYGGQSVERNELPDGRGIDSQESVQSCKATQDQRGVREGEGRKDKSRCELSIL
jgi:hypothetical protein